MGTATSTDPGTVRLLAKQALARRSGVLTVVDGKLKRLFCLERGVLVFAASNLIEEQLDEYLVRNRILAPGQRAAAKAAAAAEGKKIGPYLRDNGVLERAVLERSAADHARELLRQSLAASRGTAKFDRGTPKLEAELTVQVSCVPVVLEHVREHPQAIDQVRVGIGPPDTRPAANPAGEELLEGLELDEAGAYLMQACDGSREVATLVDESPAGPDQTLRTLYGLLLLGALVPSEVEEQRADSGGVTREEALARLALADGADHYMVLGVDSKATPDKIRSAYYLLARRFHPDRFRSGEMVDLLPKFEHYFTQVTEAYNTLADPDLRKRYDDERVLAESKQKPEKPEHDATYLAKQNFLRAKALVAKRQLQGAATFLENAIQLDGGNPAYHLELGLLLSGNPRRRDDAERSLIKTTELDPTSAAAHHGLGELYKKLGRTDDAIRCFQQALQWEPELSEAEAALAELGVKTR